VIDRILLSRWRRPLVGRQQPYSPQKHYKAKPSAEAFEMRSDDSETIAEELNLLIDGAHDYAIYMLDPSGNIAIWNKGAERLIGWSDAEAIGRHLSIFYAPDAQVSGKPAADLKAAIELGRVESEDWRVRCDGSQFLASISMTALHNKRGDLSGFGAVVSDITARRAAEDMLKWKENHLSSILSAIPNAMVVIDEIGSILSFSAAAQAMLGYTEDEVIGHNVSMLMAPPDREQHDAYLHHYLTTGQKRIIGTGRTVFAQRKDGSKIPIQLSVGESSEGSHRIFTGFLEDLTDRQAAEEKLRNLQSELIHVSRVSAMGTMASTLAHELNQPITAITNYVEAIRDQLAEPNPEELPTICDALDHTAKEALRAGHIVRRLRDFVARGYVEKTIEALPELINEAIALGLVDARELGISCDFDLHRNVSPVLVDKIQIQQVLINLIRNACEAMSDGPERQLTISARDDRLNLVHVTVSDTGPGISPEASHHLFKAFTTTKRHGMALGLSICMTIIEAHGGQIWAEPREGGGTHFHFTLKRAGKEKALGEKPTRSHR
jgi:two-component system sensor kinase FixL